MNGGWKEGLHLVSSRYVEIPAEALLARLTSIGESVTQRGGVAERGREGREVVFDLSHHQTGVRIRIYTTLTEGADTARDCGTDAIRVVVGTMAQKKGQKYRFHSLVPPRKMLRTAPVDLPEEERVEAFLSRLVQATREAYVSAGRIPTCPKCGGAMAERRVKKTGKNFYGCLFYPHCNGTRPGQS